ncbi:MAG TPA: AMP-binding protein [Methylomirabilota bacterium]|nr:AMP-binding protein [Methylomirabilota bacterium]
MLGQILPRAAARFGAKPALVTDTRTLSYAELDAFSDRVAAALAARGIAPGERVSLYSQNRWEWIVTYHGILKAGAVVNPINVMLTAKEVRYVLGDCGARAIFCGPDKTAAVLEAARDVPGVEHVVSFGEAPAGALAFESLLAGAAGRPSLPPAAPTELSTIAYTSGTTGHPKGAMQSHRAVFLNCALTGTMHVRTERDVVVTALPAPHVYGNVVINSIFMAGGTVVLMERFDPEAALDRIAHHHATLFEGVPSMYMTMLAHPGLDRVDLSSLTRCTVGGQTIAEAVMRAWEERTGAPLVELWGMTELAGLGTTHALYAPNVHGSIGVALPGVEVRVAAFEDAARTMPPGEPGELMVRGPIVMQGYYGNDKATRETIEPDGWLHTGDVAVADDAGYFKIVDRRKDMLITAGYNVYPAEIERVLAVHPAVAMSAVGPVADEVKGELARAYVVLRPGASATEAELIDFCRQHLAAYKLPRSVRFVADLPKTSTGKIMRRELRSLD